MIIKVEDIIMQLARGKTDSVYKKSILSFFGSLRKQQPSVALTAVSLILMVKPPL